MQSNQLNKLAEIFFSKTAIFENTDLGRESKSLSLLAGKLYYTSKNVNDPAKANKIKDAARLLLLAADILKS